MVQGALFKLVSKLVWHFCFGSDFIKHNWNQLIKPTVLSLSTLCCREINNYNHHILPWFQTYFFDSFLGEISSSSFVPSSSVQTNIYKEHILHLYGIICSNNIQGVFCMAWFKSWLISNQATVSQSCRRVFGSKNNFSFHLLRILSILTKGLCFYWLNDYLITK